MHLRHISVFLSLVATAGAVEIVPPSPYMSSPPPAQADTSVVDPGRKPKCITVEPGIQEAWFAEWNLSTDRAQGSPLDISAPRSGRPTYRAAFNDHGWPVELSYFDPKGSQRWTKLFRYPAKVPAGPGDVPYSASWINGKGSAIQMSKVAAAFKANEWKASTPKYQVSDLLGEPLIVESGSGGAGSGETWIYLIDDKEIKFQFNKDNRLVSAPATAEPEPVKVVAPAAATPTPKDTAKAAKAPVQPVKKGKKKSSE